MNSEKKRVIPFGKAERVGNYKVWRSKTKLTYTPSDEERAKVRKESGGTKRAVGKSMDIDVINVSNLDGSWKVSIPSTMMMYSTIMMGYAEEDDNRREQFLTMLFSNFLLVSTNSNVYVHDAFAFLMEMMQFPYMLLPEKEMEKRMKAGLKEAGWEKGNANAYIKEMMDKRKQLYALIDDKIQRFVADFEEDRKARLAKEDEANKALDQDEIAEQAMEVLNESGQE